MFKRLQMICFGIGALAAYAHADPPKINMPESQPSSFEVAVSTSGVPAVDPGPLSTTVADPSNKDWKEYSNRIVKMQARIKSSWTMMEVKETQDTGSVGFTISRNPLATFSVTRQPLDGPFEAYISSPALTQIYPVGFDKSPAVFAGRKSILVKGKALDERWDESYFSAHGKMLTQVSFSAPKDAWKEMRPVFDDLKKSFRWIAK